MTNKIMLVGEAWGEAEEREGRPFVGMAGKVLDGILEEVGIKRDECTITNVINKRPPANNFQVFYDKKNPTPELLEAYDRLKLEVASAQPNVIVCLGSEAMKALVGHGGVLDWRGSVLDTPHGKVIPTIHPAAVLREWTYRPAVVADLTRALKESAYPEVRRTERTLTIGRNYKEVLNALQEIKQAHEVAFDIETETEQICSIAFSWKEHEAISIPFWFKASGSLWSPEEELEIWTCIKDILESELPRKIAHNGNYDLEYLKHTMGIEAKLHFDTMLAFHTLYSELPKALSFLVSLYTDHPFYKYQLRTDSMDEFFRYNATDACLTLECAHHLERELRDNKLQGFYASRVHPLHRPLLDMQYRGVKFDVDKLSAVRRTYTQDLERLKEELKSQVGHDLNPASHPQMTKWLYEELKLDKQYKLRKDSKEKTLSADNEALETLYAKTKNEALKTVLEIREKQKVLSTYLDITLDKDKRVRCSYLITGTETGRLSSRQTARGTGTNLQNIPSGVVKSLFIADEEKTFINADLSQAEARVVAYLCGDQRFIRVFEAGGDIHRKNAANIFGKREDEITDEERQLAKRVVHASNYGMGPVTFSKQTGMDIARCKRLLAQYFATYPRIKLWHKEVEHKLRTTRSLENPLGRKRLFFNRWGESVLKEGLAFLPQSTVADVMNQALVCMHEKGIELLLQVHDSVLVQCETSRVDEVARQVRDCLTIPIEINRRRLLIPVDLKVGVNWEEMTKLKVGEVLLSK